MGRSVSNDRRAKLKERQNADKGGRAGGGGFSVLDTSDYSDIPWLKLEPGTEYVFDVMSYEVTTKKHPDYAQMKKVDFMEDYRLIVPVHRQVGPGKKSVVCPQVYGKPCPICEEHDKILGERGRDAWGEDDVRALRPSKRCFMILIDKLDKDTMKFWEYSAAWGFDNLKKRADRKDILIGDMIFDELSIVFTPEESQFDKKKPGEIKTFDFENEGKYDYDEKDIAEAPKLDTMLKVNTYEEIYDLFHGVVDESDEDSEEKEEVEEAPRSRRQRNAEPEATPEVEEEPEEEDASARRRRRRKEEPAQDATPVCPEDGLTFGVDTDSVDACDNCKLYDACDAAEKASAKKTEDDIPF